LLENKLTEVKLVALALVANVLVLVELVTVAEVITALVPVKSVTVPVVIVVVARLVVPVAVMLLATNAPVEVVFTPVALTHERLVTLSRLAQRFWKLPQIPVVEATVVEANVEVPYELIVSELSKVAEAELANRFVAVALVRDALEAKRLVTVAVPVATKLVVDADATCRVEPVALLNVNVCINPVIALKIDANRFVVVA
jgi:hypothetical protein